MPTDWLPSQRTSRPPPLGTTPASRAPRSRDRQTIVAVAIRRRIAIRGRRRQHVDASAARIAFTAVATSRDATVNATRYRRAPRAAPAAGATATSDAQPGSSPPTSAPTAHDQQLDHREAGLAMPPRHGSTSGRDRRDGVRQRGARTAVPTARRDLRAARGPLRGRGCRSPADTARDVARAVEGRSWSLPPGARVRIAATSFERSSGSAGGQVSPPRRAARARGPQHRDRGESVAGRSPPGDAIPPPRAPR